MTTCSLAKPGVSVAGYVTLTYKDGVITESTAKDRTTKPRSRDFPKLVYGNSPLTHLGTMILQRIADGYQVQQEAPELSRNRITSVFTVKATPLLAVLLGSMLCHEQLRVLHSGTTVQAHGMLISHSTVNDEVVLRVTFLKSALERIHSTYLAVLNRCSRECTSADFIGDFYDLADIVRPLVDYELLGDHTLDGLQKVGLPLRIVDYRRIAPAMAGFVGF